MGFGVDGLGLVGRGLCMKVWSRWVGIGQWWFVRVGLELVGWGWSVGVCASAHLEADAVPSGPMLQLCCMKVWGWWVESGHSRFVLLSLGLVGWGWSGVVCAGQFGG